MTGLLLAILIPAGYTAAWIATARQVFYRQRPDGPEPQCRTSICRPKQGYHSSICDISEYHFSRRMWAWAALGIGLAWPVFLAFLLPYLAVTFRPRLTPAELKAKAAAAEARVKELERQLL